MPDNRSTRFSPAHVLLAALLASLAAAALAVVFTLNQPWLGLTLLHDDQPEGLAVVAATGPSRGIPAGSRLLAVGTPGGAILALRDTDLIEEPDFFDTYEQMAAFFARQSSLTAMLEETTVRLDLRLPDGRGVSREVSPGERPLASLPAVFWFQLAAGFSGFLIACWVLVLRPGDWGARMFFLTGLMFPFFTVPAAVYSGRELALDGEVFRALSSLNHFGAFMFGCALVAIFLCHPRPLVRPRTLLWLPAVFGTWLLADVFRLAPDQDWGSRLPVMTEMLLAVVFAAAQWRLSRRHPVDRAALRWFILSVVVGSGLFIASTAGASLLGLFPPLSQGYSFGFFLLMYAGLALGIRRYRLFELDTWAYRTLLWALGALAIIAMDAALILALGLNATLSLGVTLLVCGLLYFPLRQWLWEKITGRRAIGLEELLPEVTRIAFAETAETREQRWHALLRRLHDPLEIVPDPAGSVEAARVAEDGLNLAVPACGGCRPVVLKHARHGSRLFSPADARLLASLCVLLEQAAAGRDAYERGVNQERRRIAQDIHDDIGARLLMLIHRARDPQEAELARSAMSDLRTTIAALDAQPVSLADALADWRAEMDRRCESAGVQARWSQNDPPETLRLTPRIKSTLERVLREGVTNALKHATPSQVAVDARVEDGHFHLSIANDGVAPPPEHWQDGFGLRNIRKRLRELGGELDLRAGQDGGATLAIRLPLGTGQAPN